MKHFRLTVAAVAITGALALASVAAAQIPVTDVAHIAVSQNQTLRDELEWIEKLWYLVENYKRIEDAYARDVQDIIEAANSAIHHEDAKTYAGHAARKLYAAVFDDELTIRPNEAGVFYPEHVFSEGWLLGDERDGVSAEAWRDYWRKVQHDTYYGVLDATWQIHEDIWRSGEELAELRGQLATASGESQLLQAVGYIAAAQLEETRRLNQQLAVLTNLEVLQKSYENAYEHTAANTARDLIYREGWDDPLPYGTFPAMPRLGAGAGAED